MRLPASDIATINYCLGPSRYVIAESVWIDTAIGDSPEEFHLKTPVTRLTVPIDFNEVVYAETTKTAEVSFNWQYDRTSPNLLQVYSSLVDVNPHDIKNSFKITCDWQRKIAKVTSSYTVNNQPQEDTRDYRIISYDPKNVCLVYETDNAVMVITMNSEIGSFVVSKAWAPGFGIVNGTLIWYGTCRN
jgi:hypothetical protein